MSTWRYAKDGQPCGPVATTELQTLLSNGTIPPATLVWKEGMADWVPASTLPELAAAALPQAAPPPPAAASAPPAPGAPPPLRPPISDAADIEQNKIFAALAYVGILFLVPLLAAPQSKFARYHTNQGIVLFLATTILCGGGFVLSFIPLVGCIAFLVPLTGAVGALVLMIIGIINAVSGQAKPLPLIGQFEVIK